MIKNSTIININNISVLLNSEFVSKKMNYILRKKDYEKDEVNILIKNLKPSDIYLELGAGIGVTSITAAKILNNTPIVYEANPILCKYLKENSKLNRTNLKIYNAAISNTNSKFYIHENFWSSSLKKHENTIDEVEVPIHTLKTLLDKHCPTFLFCDIEGEEINIFKNTDISTIHTLCVEFHDQYVNKSDINNTIIEIIQKGFLYGC